MKELRVLDTVNKQCINTFCSFSTHYEKLLQCHNQYFVCFEVCLDIHTHISSIWNALLNKEYAL